MSSYLSLPPDLAKELEGFVRQTISRARMHNHRLARDTPDLSDEQVHSLADAHQLGAEIRAVVDDTISSTLHGRDRLNTCPLPEDLPSEILRDIWSCLDFRGRFAVTGVCRSWRAIGLATPPIWQHIEYVNTSHSNYCSCSRCHSGSQRYTWRGSNLDQVQLALARGGRRDIHLNMKMLVRGLSREKVCVDNPMCESFVSGVSSHLDRVQSWTFITDGYEYLRNFPSITLPNLKVFRIVALGSEEELSRRFLPANDMFVPWAFDVQAPQLECFHSPNSVITWPYIPSHLINVTRFSIGVGQSLGFVRNMITACPLLEHVKLFVLFLDPPKWFPDEVTQSRPWKTLTIAEIPNQLEQSKLEQERDSVWHDLLSLQAHDFTLEYALDEDSYIVPSHGLRLFSENLLLGGFALQVISIAGNVVTVSRKDISSTPDEAIDFDDIPGPVKSITFDGDALCEVVQSNSMSWLADVWALYVQLGEYNFDDTVIHIISVLPRIRAEIVLFVMADTAERGRKFVARVRMLTENLPSIKSSHIITPKGTIIELLSAQI